METSQVKVYLIKTDVATTVHCGCRIERGGEYLMLRTPAPRWVSLCQSCVALLSTPTRVDMAEVVRACHRMTPNEVVQKVRRERLEKAAVRKSERMIRSEVRGEWI